MNVRVPPVCPPGVQGSHSRLDGLAALAAAAAGEAGDQGGQQEPAQAESEDGEVSHQVLAVVGRLSGGEVSQEIAQYYNHLSSKLQNTRVTSSSAKVSLDSVPF